ncbi:MAG: hypothetical protein R3257_02665, partial [bacterium]|nr:hypothetical protein [bacterium]
ASRLQTVQEFQWALMNQTPPSVLRSMLGQVSQAEYFPQAWKGWQQGRKGPPPWAQKWAKPGKGKKPKEFKEKGPKGHGSPPWGKGNHGGGKNKGKFK